MLMTQPENNAEGTTPLGFPNINGVSYSTSGESDGVTSVSASITEISSGPLPNPDYLEKYDRIIPNGAERIMIMAEKEQENRHISQREIREIDKDKIDRQLRYMNRGQIMAFVLSFVILGLATLFVFTGHETMAYVLFAVSLISLVGLFLGIKNSERKK